LEQSLAEFRARAIELQGEICNLQKERDAVDKMAEDGQPLIVLRCVGRSDTLAPIYSAVGKSEVETQFTALYLSYSLGSAQLEDSPFLLDRNTYYMFCSHFRQKKNVDFYDYAVFRDILARCFGEGLQPAWFAYYVNKFEPKVLWGNRFQEPESRHPKSLCYANVVFSSEHCLIKNRKAYVKTLLSEISHVDKKKVDAVVRDIIEGKIRNGKMEMFWSDLVSYVSDVVDKICSPKGTSSISDTVLRAIYPCCDEELRVREKFTPHAICIFCASMYSDYGASGLSSQEEVKKAIRDIFLVSLGHGSQFLGRILALYFSVPTARIYLKRYLAGDYFSCVGLEAIYNELKLTHSAFHRNLDLVDPDIQLSEEEEPLFDSKDAMYMHLCIGRYVYDSIQLDKDFRKRTEVTLHQATLSDLGDVSDLALDRDVYEAWEDWIPTAVLAKEEFSTMKAQDVVRLWRRIGTKGSVDNKYKQILTDAAGREITADRYTKGLWSSLCANLEMVKSVLASKPEMSKRILRKLESGRVRILQPSSVPFWLLECLGLISSEDAIYKTDEEVSLMLSATEDLDEFIKRVTEMRSSIINVDTDYSDMNYLHVLVRFSKLWATFSEAFSGVAPLRPSQRWADMSLLDIMRYATSWLSHAILNLYIARPGDDEFQKHVQGLWSGMLITTFKNTSSNKAYKALVDKRLLRSFPDYQPVTDPRYLGDDMKGRSKCEWSALLFCKGVDDSGLDAQRDKQNVAATQDEYLRIITHGGRVTGSVVRTIVQSLSSDMQSPPVETDIALAEAFSASICVWTRRGAIHSVACYVLKALCKTWCQLRTYPHGLEKPSVFVPVAEEFIFASLRSGGLGAHFPGVPCHRLCPIMEWKPPSVSDTAKAVFGTEIRGDVIPSAVESEAQRFKDFGVRFESREETSAVTMLSALSSALPRNRKIEVLSKRDSVFLKAVQDWKSSGNGRVLYFDRDVLGQLAREEARRMINELHYYISSDTKPSDHLPDVDFGNEIEAVKSAISDVLPTEAMMMVDCHTGRTLKVKDLASKLMPHRVNAAYHTVCNTLPWNMARIILRAKDKSVFGINTFGTTPDNQVVILRHIVSRVLSSSKVRFMSFQSQYDLMSVIGSIGFTASECLAKDDRWKNYMMY
jgi:hypothetical protein